MQKNILERDRYFVTPYNENHKPLISFLMNCRLLRSLNDKSSIYTMLDSFNGKLSKEDKSKIEIIVKFDVDDKEVIDKLLLDNQLQKKYPDIVIRPIIYDRWEGRKSLNLHYAFIFTRRNPNSKFIGFITDDVIIQENPIPYIEKYKNEEYCILSHCHNLEILNGITDWKTNITRWSCGNLTEPYPIVSSKIFEICGNMGYQVNIDNWLALLNVILFVKYKIDLYIDVPDFFHRDVFTNGKFIPQNFQPSNFNWEWFVDDSIGTTDNYYYNLVEQQADNIYYNIKYGI